MSEKAKAAGVKLQRKTKDGEFLCFPFNAKGIWCDGWCGNLHQCMVVGCGGSHPKHSCPMIKAAES